jgi:teichuronic acid biosynthesis glycosyltransferase TuaC
MRVLVLTRTYPNPAQPAYGVFVRERVRRVAARCALEVVAPIPRFPLDRLAPRPPRHAVPHRERDGAIAVHHPAVLSVPGIGKSLDGMLYALSLLPFLRRLRRRFPFDLIDAHFGYPDGVGAVLLASALGCGVTITLRGHEADLARRPLRRRQMGFAVRRARVIAVNQPLAAFARTLGAAAERVRVIPNGIDRGMFHPGERADARRRLGLPVDRCIVLSVGAFVPRKRYEDVLAALPAVIQHRPDLLFIGIGSRGGIRNGRPSLERRVRRAALGDHVRLLDVKPHEEIAWWLRAADLFCLATVREGSSNALCEALACGLPVVTTRVGGNTELVRDGIDGYLVPPCRADVLADAIVRALDTPWDRGAIALRAAARTWDQVADEVLEELRAACGRLVTHPPHTS